MRYESMFEYEVYRKNCDENVMYQISTCEEYSQMVCVTRGKM